MNKFFHMDNNLFDIWTEQLVDRAYDWKQIGISNDYCNKISEPAFGLKIINWPDKAFEVVDEHKFTVFLLRYR